MISPVEESETGSHLVVLESFHSPLTHYFILLISLMTIMLLFNCIMAMDYFFRVKTFLAFSAITVAVNPKRSSK